ncbi:hypothetical protein XI03_09560 [Bradyrhizobium sp. CCBAU 65884]|nr:hypothetical protein [Bradyrhizobium sp. CCBAU 65884]
MCKSASYREANREKLAAYGAAYYAANCDKRATQGAAWEKANRDKRNTINANRRARKRKATVPLTQDEMARIKAIYAEAETKTRETGTTWHVDHILPLSKGGLHHLNNLIAIPAGMNLTKHDDYWPDLYALQ